MEAFLAAIACTLILAHTTRPRHSQLRPKPKPVRAESNYDIYERNKRVAYENYRLARLHAEHGHQD